MENTEKIKALTPEIYEYRRQQLLYLIREEYKGVDAKLASRVGLDPSILSRMLYPPNKENKKNIGDETILKIEKFHPYWLFDELKRQLLNFYDGMTGERRDALLSRANDYYNESHPEAGPHMPDVSRRGAQNTKKKINRAA